MLNESPIPEGIQVEQIEFQQLVPIVIYFLRRSGEQIEDVKIGTNMGQRYKIVTPLIEKVKQRGVSIDITLLLNPNPSDVRNMLLSLLTKSE